VRIFHFYHVFADGGWQKPLAEQLAALDYCGLSNELDGLFFGIVGSRENRELVKSFLPGEIVVESDRGWEQVTLNRLHEFAQSNDGVVLYSHTKGAWSSSDLAHRWRQTMIQDTVLRWPEIVPRIPPYDVAGSFWLRSPEPEHRHHGFFFAGNFWWANLEYVRGLPELQNQHRFQAEGWLGLGQPNALGVRHGLATSTNFAGPLPFEAPEIEVV